MVSDIFSRRLERSDLVIMERDPNSKKNGYSANSYQLVLNDQIPRVYKPGIAFMQDNVRIHTAKIILN